MKSSVPEPLPTNQFVFEKIRSKNMIYVDKTQLIYDMISKPDYYFLARPRRFGKSLLVSILKHSHLVCIPRQSRQSLGTSHFMGFN